MDAMNSKTGNANNLPIIGLLIAGVAALLAFTQQPSLWVGIAQVVAIAVIALGIQQQGQTQHSLRQAFEEIHQALEGKNPPSFSAFDYPH